jgi:hypothetical protein
MSQTTTPTLVAHGVLNGGEICSIELWEKTGIQLTAEQQQIIQRNMEYWVQKLSPAATSPAMVKVEHIINDWLNGVKTSEDALKEITPIVKSQPFNVTAYGALVAALQDALNCDLSGRRVLCDLCREKAEAALLAAKGQS